MRRHPVLIVIAVLASLAALAVALFALRFDASRYKPELIELVRARTGRTLAIEGKLSLKLLPRIGLAMGPARLSGPGGNGEFAQFDSARIGVALWPLLAHRIVVEQVTLDGLKLALLRHRDGSTNFDDLLGAGSATRDGSGNSGGAGATAALAVANMRLRHATIEWRDQASGAQWRLEQLELDGGPIASDRSGSLSLSTRLTGERAQVDVAVKLSGNYTLDFATRALRLDAIRLALSGQAPGAPALEVQLRGSLAADPASGRFDLSGLDLTARSGDGLQAQVAAPALAIEEGSASGRPIAVQLSADRGGRRMVATIAIAAPTRARERILFREVKADVTLSGARLPSDGVKLALTGDASLDPSQDKGSLALRGSIDGSTLQARLEALRFSPLTLSYTLQAGRIDLDRYPAAPGATAEQPAAAALLSVLADIDTRGSLHLGSLALAGIDASNVAATLRSGQGRIELAQLTAGVFRGALQASGSLTREGRHALRMKLVDVDAGLALRALSGRDVLEGHGNLSLDVTARGQALPALERSLDGTAALALRNGAIKGVDLAELLASTRELIAALRGSGSSLERAASRERMTAFSSLDASFTIRKGVAHNDDLDLRSTLLRVRGAGQVDLAGETVDYLARVSVNDTGHRSGTLSALRGVTIPVRLRGPFTALSYRVDVADLVAQTARRELTRRLEEELIGKPSGAAKPSDRPLDLLRGLLGR